jgi:hypothetical protein
MVSKINEKKIVLYGHGSGFPREKEMNTVHIKRFETKSETPIGNRGLIRVRQFIRDNDDIDDNYTEKFYCKERKLYKSNGNGKVIGIVRAFRR